METTVLRGPAESTSAPLSGVRLSAILVLIVWFALVASLGAAGAFVGPPRTPPIAVGVGVGAPLLVFFAWMRFSPSFRGMILSLDLRLIVGMQGWRWAGFGFLALYAHNVLPAVFALPAGLGDMAVGIAAPWMVLGLIRQPGFATSAKFVRWNLLGILDLVVAVSIATLSATLATGAPGEISTAPMATLPLVLIPVFFVPLFLMMHATALMQSRQMIRRA
jgi:hypothetical protein